MTVIESPVKRDELLNATHQAALAELGEKLHHINFNKLHKRLTRSVYHGGDASLDLKISKNLSRRLWIHQENVRDFVNGQLQELGETRFEFIALKGEGRFDHATRIIIGLS